MLPEVIGALLAQEHPVEVVIADDGSTDNTADVVGSFPVKYVYQQNRGPAAARNTGAKAASGEILAFTDSDCLASPDWTKRLVEGFDDEAVGVVAGSYGIANPNKILPCLIHEEIKWRHSRFGEFVRAFGSYNFAIRRELFEGLGGFDESYGTASGEDNDLSYRVLKAGYKIRFSPDALVAHYHTEGLWKYLKEQARHGYWRMKLYGDHPDMARGDDYTRNKDIAEPPLALASLLLLPLMKLSPVFLLPAAFLLLMEVPFASRIMSFKGDIRYLLLAPLAFLRAYARMMGMARGAGRFLFRGRRP
jgi:cellulose synthase/poly-beta-1,6-N-acetylglucosamine synthase-like glycosyltransferase